jgi:hypothetical protein
LKRSHSTTAKTLLFFLPSKKNNRELNDFVWLLIERLLVRDEMRDCGRMFGEGREWNVFIWKCFGISRKIN